MAFEQRKLVKSINQSRDIFDKFIYSPENGDTINDILSTGYFAKSRYVNDPDWVGSIIEINAADGYFFGAVTPDGNIINISPAGVSPLSLGWEFVVDTEYPDFENGLSIDADTWIRLPNNGFQIPNATNLPSGVTTWYNSTDDKLEFDALNSWISNTIVFGIVPAAANSFFTIRGIIDAPSPLPFFGPTTIPLEVDAGEANPQFIPTSFPVTQNVLDFGIYYEINCSRDAVIYQAGYLIAKEFQK